MTHQDDFPVIYVEMDYEPEIEDPRLIEIRHEYQKLNEAPSGGTTILIGLLLLGFGFLLPELIPALGFVPVLIGLILVLFFIIKGVL